MANNEIPLFPGNTYHIYNHANGFENIFQNEDNYNFFLKKYAQYISAIAETYAYALMPNHFHFLIRIKSGSTLWKNFQYLKTPQKGRIQLKKHQILDQIYSSSIAQEEYLSLQLSRQFANFFSAYTQAFNLQQQRSGSLFMSNFKRKAVLNESYFSKIIHYIHFNPVHHHFVNHPSIWTHSSYSSILSDKSTLLLRDEVLNFFGGRDGFISTHEQKGPFEIDW